MNGVRALPPHEDTCKKTVSQKQGLVSHRCRVRRWCFGLGLPASGTVIDECLPFQSPSLWWHSMRAIRRDLATTVTCFLMWTSHDECVWVEVISERCCESEKILKYFKSGRSVGSQDIVGWSWRQGLCSYAPPGQDSALLSCSKKGTVNS